MSAVAATHKHEKTSVLVFYNGESRSIDYEPHERMQALLERGENAFGITTNRHLMSLYTEAGAELPDNQSIEADGVEPGQKLILRQSTVKGG